MKSRQEIEMYIANVGHHGSERADKIMEAVLEVMLDVREAMLDKEEARDAYFNATKAFEKVVEERMKGEQQMTELLEATKTANDGHPGWICDDAHPNVAHEAWLRGELPATTYDNPYGVESSDGLELGGAADQAAEAQAELASAQDPTEANE